MTAAPRDWVEYWDGLGEGQLLFPPEAEEYARNLGALIELHRGLRVLEYGCGYGFVAELLAGRVGAVALYDAAPRMLSLAARRLAGRDNVRIADLGGDERYDLVLVNSVVQYMDEAEFGERLCLWRRLMGPNGKVVVSDLISPRAGSARDVVSLAWFSARRGYLLRAARNVLAERGRYGRMAEARPLYRPGRDDVVRLARAAGLATRFAARNLTHFAARATAILTESNER